MTSVDATGTFYDCSLPGTSKAGCYSAPTPSKGVLGPTERSSFSIKQMPNRLLAPGIPDRPNGSFLVQSDLSVEAKASQTLPK
jgi:hypothetical protein